MVVGAPAHGMLHHQVAEVQPHQIDHDMLRAGKKTLSGRSHGPANTAWTSHCAVVPENLWSSWAVLLWLHRSLQMSRRKWPVVFLFWRGVWQRGQGQCPFEEAKTAEVQAANVILSLKCSPMFLACDLTDQPPI